MSPARSLMNIENKVGDNTQHCFSPELISNHSESSPFTVSYAARNFGVKGFNKIKEGAMYTNHACILSHNDVLERESNTFCKSMKQAKVNLPTYFFLPSRMELREKILWSWRL